jgi:hypothetical protein
MPNLTVVLRVRNVLKKGYKVFPSRINTGCLEKKNGSRYNFVIDNPNEKKYTGNGMALKRLQT